MIRVERVTSEQAQGLCTVPVAVADKSIDIWAAYHDETLLLVVGAHRESLLGPAKIWLVLLQPRLSALKAIRMITLEAKRQFRHILAAALPGRDARFAKFCGLRKAGVEDKWVRFEL